MSRNLTPDLPCATDGHIVVAESVELAPVLSARLTFTFKARGMSFLAGPAGSGKSTLIDVLSFHGLPTGGRIRVLGVDPTKLAPADRPSWRRRIGVVFQDLRLLPELDVFENVALAARAAERRPQDYAGSINELLSWVGLAGREPESIAELSEGERRRLCIARALVNRPDLLLVDEPTVGLDEKTAGTILRLITEANAAGTPVVFATRDRDLAHHFGGSIYNMPMCGS